MTDKRIQITRPKKVKNSFEFFKEWLKIIKSFSKLGDAELDFLAAILSKRHELSKVILDETILTQVLFNKESKDEIIEKLNLKDIQTFENKASQLRKKGIILEGNKIDPRYIPQVNKDLKMFRIMFTIVTEEDAEG